MAMGSLGEGRKVAAMRRWLLRRLLPRNQAIVEWALLADHGSAVENMRREIARRFPDATPGGESYLIRSYMDAVLRSWYEVKRAL